MKSLRFHTRRRFEERVGMFYSKKLENIIVSNIQHGLSKHIKTQSRTRTIHDVSVRGKELRVVYDKQRGTIVTVLPRVKECLYSKKTQ